MDVLLFPSSCVSSDTSFSVIVIVRQDTVEEKVNSTVTTYRDQKVEHEENVFDEGGSAS